MSNPIHRASFAIHWLRHAQTNLAYVRSLRLPASKKVMLRHAETAVKQRLDELWNAQQALLAWAEEEIGVQEDQRSAALRNLFGTPFPSLTFSVQGVRDNSLSADLRR